ncbi:MAG TPA: MATE family efflux transporter [Clostridia bacterium]
MDHSQQLGESSIPSLLIKFSIPAIVGMLVNSLYNVIDRIFIGNSAGKLGIAGVTIAFPIMLVTIAFVLLIGVGANSLVSIKLGEGNRDEAEHILGNAVTLLVIVSAIITILGLIFLEPILIFFGASSDVLPYAKDYMQIILCGTIFQTIGFGLNNFIRGEGNPKTAMITMLAGSVLNAAFCPIFIFGFKMGVRGSALATVLAQGISALWVLFYFLSGRSILKIRKKYLVLSNQISKRIIAVGSAQFAMEFTMSFVITIYNKSLIKYGGDIAISGMGIVTSLQTLILMPLFGINQGVQPIIGYNYGAKKFDRVKEALKLAITGASIITVLGFIFIEAFPHQIVGLFNRTDRELIDFSVYALRTSLIMLPVLGFQVVGSGYFMAVGRPKPAAVLSLSRQFILLVPAILILPVFFKLNGVILSGPIADTGSFILTVIWLLWELNHLNSKHEEQMLGDQGLVNEE